MLLDIVMIISLLMNHYSGRSQKKRIRMMTLTAAKDALTFGSGGI